MSDLLAEVRARHYPDPLVRLTGTMCERCLEPWPCDAAKLAALLTPERLAAAMTQHRHEATTKAGPHIYSAESCPPFILAVLTSEEPLTSEDWADLREATGHDR